MTATPTEPPLRIGIVLGSTRPGRNAEAVGRWVLHHAQSRADGSEYRLIDIADYHLPLLDEPIPPAMGRYSRPHTKAWAEAIAACDAFVFVTPEYQHSTSASLKNAIDYLYAEWVDKAAGFVSYGSAGGVRAVEHLRQILAEVQVATVRAQVWFSLTDDFEEFRIFRPREAKRDGLFAMLDQLRRWGTALRDLRQREAAGGAEAVAKRS
ncbi:MAG: NAD(P)H-dependent oxidoreductase [Thermoplasmata archaeon]